ncbi:MAG: hypothetical protein SCH70_08895 [Candidatus Methanoperedens sp.]|nr:hypothetical protein [Candidatus Methanoperedens sp.]
MNKYISGIVTALLILGMVSGTAAGNVPVPIMEPVVAVEGMQSVPAMYVGEMQTGNFTKLEISPRYGNLRLQPGENKEITVTIKNKENKAVSVKSNIVAPPYSEYILEKEWITVTPDSAELPAGESRKFTIKATIPEDATAGYYNAQVAFTDEVIPTPYPQPFPNYIHQFSLSIDLWAPPVLQIMTPYISDQLEAGKEYDYEIKIKNTGDTAKSINPKIGNDGMYYGPFGSMTAAFNDDAITITSPQSIPAGATVAVKVHVKVPSDSKGRYNGVIELGLDDPSINRFGQGGVQLNFNIWKQPTEPFVKSFTMEKDAPITIEISSNYFGDIYRLAMLAGGQGTKNTKEPSFETSLKDSSGNVELNITKTVIKGTVSMGGEIPPWEIESSGIYQQMGTQYLETYTVNGHAGEWELSVLPSNTETFEYTITIGE